MDGLGDDLSLVAAASRAGSRALRSPNQADRAPRACSDVRPPGRGRLVAGLEVGKDAPRLLYAIPAWSKSLLPSCCSSSASRWGCGWSAGRCPGGGGCARVSGNRRARSRAGSAGAEAPVRRQLLLPVGVNNFCRLRGSEIGIEEGDACVACGRRLRRPKRGGKRASSTVTRSPDRWRAFSTPLAGCTGPREFGSRTDHRAGAQRARSRPRTRSEDRRRGHARFRTADAQELAKSGRSSGRTAWLRNRGTIRSRCP